MLPGLLKDALCEAQHTKVLIDGFPRVFDQLKEFEKQVSIWDMGVGGTSSNSSWVQCLHVTVTWNSPCKQPTTHPLACLACTGAALQQGAVLQDRGGGSQGTPDEAC